MPAARKERVRLDSGEEVYKLFYKYRNVECKRKYFLILINTQDVHFILHTHVIMSYQ